MPEHWLLDNSAWARSRLPHLPTVVANKFADELQARRFGVCLPFRMEAGYSARDATELTEITRALDQLPAFDFSVEAQSRALVCQAQLAAVGHHRVPAADLMIAAIADIERLGVIHYDADYDRILEHSDLRFESRWLAPRGSL